jgi:hypothetical protein
MPSPTSLSTRPAGSCGPSSIGTTPSCSAALNKPLPPRQEPLCIGMQSVRRGADQHRSGASHTRRGRGTACRGAPRGGTEPQLQRRSVLTALVFWQTVHWLLGPAPGLPVTGVLSSALEQLAFDWVYQNARWARLPPSLLN